MLKAKCVLLIFLISLLHPISCNEAEIGVVRSLEFLQSKIGFCSKYFQYFLSDVFIIGQLTLPNVKLGDTVRMEFYQNALKLKMHFNGSLLPEDSPEEVINKVRNGQPITYRIDFPIGDNIPELRYVYINDKEFCATILKNVGKKIVLTHTLDIVNNSLSVFKGNINIPQFTVEPSCSADDMEVASNELYGISELRCGEYPWLTAIYKKRGTGKSYICSGLLVTSRIVLTAANCFLGLEPEEIIVYLGRYNVTDSAKDDIVVRETEAVIKHPDYRPGLYSSDADIALLKMKEPVSFTKFIQSICLWSEPVDEPQIIGNSDLMTSGGANTTEPNNATEMECQRSSPVFAVVTSPRILCTDEHGIPEPIHHTPCADNSSAELMLNRKPRWLLRGITFQQLCNQQEQTVYCDIPKHMPWLGNYIEPEAQPITGTLENVCGKSDMITRRQQPWLAAIYRKMSTGVLFFCTGTLISSRTVVASANCFDMSGGETVHGDYIRVYLGRYDLNSINENGVETRDVANLLIHPSYKNTGGLFYDDDIALLQLQTPVGFTQYIKPICLWSTPDNRTEIVGETATLSSWNKLGIMDHSLSIAQSMEVNIVALRQCQITGYNVNITSSPFLCTPRFGNNLDGILMLKRNERWLLRGLSSTNFFYWNKYNSTRFRLYTDISEYLPWIQSNMLT